MQAAGETLGSLSTGFADLLSLGSEGAASSESSLGHADNLDPTSRLQALGKSLFEALKKGGWPAGQPIELKLDATGQLSTSSASTSNVALVDQYLDQHPEVGNQLEDLTTQLREQYQFADASGQGLSTNAANGSWHISLSEQGTKWRWSGV
jgi:hypothetical protein